MNSAVLAQKGEYNFAISGGAASTISLNVIVPQKMFLSAINLGIITSLTSGGSATIDFGYDAIGSSAASSNNAFTSGGAIAIASLVSTGSGGYSIPATFFSGSFAFDITMTINVAALTAGRFIIVPVFSPMIY